MGAIEDIRGVLQDLIAPELKAIAARTERIERQTDRTDERLAKIETLVADLRVTLGQVIVSMELDRRVVKLEQKAQNELAKEQ